MQRTPGLQVKAMVLTPPMAATTQNVAGQLAPPSRKTYTIDAKHFAQMPSFLAWLPNCDEVLLGALQIALYHPNSDERMFAEDVLSQEGVGNSSSIRDLE